MGGHQEEPNGCGSCLMGWITKKKKKEKKSRISPMNEDRNPEGNRTSLCGFDSLAGRSGSKREKEAQRRGLSSEVQGHVQVQLLCDTALTHAHLVILLPEFRRGQRANK